MFASIERTGNIYTANADFSWGEDLDAVIRIVSHHFADFNGNGFYPHPDEESLQDELLTVPTLRELSLAMRQLNARGMAIHKLGLNALSESHRNAVLYAIALTQGFPTSTDQRTQRVAWDVRSRSGAEQSSRFVTFSERTGSADMHTDSSFYPMPEEQFMLYVVAAARCNGGQSLMVDVEDIYDVLQSTDAGRAAYTILRDTPLPFRVPSVYAANDENVEYHLATVFTEPQKTGDGLSIRWRYDSILKGLAIRPDLDSVEVAAALQLMNTIVEAGAPRFNKRLEDDTLLWADNHHTLHGRAIYQDPGRHLIRIRISNTPNAHRIGPSGTSLD